MDKNRNGEEKIAGTPVVKERNAVSTLQTPSPPLTFNRREHLSFLTGAPTSQSEDGFAALSSASD